jgi:hypothetical protein
MGRPKATIPSSARAISGRCGRIMALDPRPQVTAIHLYTGGKGPLVSTAKRNGAPLLPWPIVGVVPAHEHGVLMRSIRPVEWRSGRMAKPVVDKASETKDARQREETQHHGHGTVHGNRLQLQCTPH